MTMRPSADCKPYERPWRDWAVDRNLDDHWLERLNDPETFNLIDRFMKDLITIKEEQ